MITTKMKFLLISILLAILHIKFYRMEPNPKHTRENVPQDNMSCNAALSCSGDLFKSRKMGDNDTQEMTTEIANEAAEVAKGANEALSAAAQNASYQVQLLMADRAMAAASTAHSLAEVKQAIVDSYAKEIQETEAVVAQIRSSLETSQANAHATCAALKMTDNHTVAIHIVMNEIRSGIEDLDFLAEQVQVYLEEKQKNVAKVKKRGDYLSREIAKAEEEYEKVKVATCKAIEAARDAQQKLFCIERPSPRNHSNCDSLINSIKVNTT
ncbi:hypothetical protein KR032_010127, partial [Drosophila birchii]